MKQEASEAYHDWDAKPQGLWIWFNYFPILTKATFIIVHHGLVILAIIGMFIEPGMDLSFKLDLSNATTNSDHLCARVPVVAVYSTTRVPSMSYRSTRRPLVYTLVQVV